MTNIDIILPISIIVYIIYYMTLPCQGSLYDQSLKFLTSKGGGNVKIFFEHLCRGCSKYGLYHLHFTRRILQYLGFLSKPLFVEKCCFLNG